MEIYPEVGRPRPLQDISHICVCASLGLILTTSKSTMPLLCASSLEPHLPSVCIFPQRSGFRPPVVLIEWRSCVCMFLSACIPSPSLTYPCPYINPLCVYPSCDLSLCAIPRRYSTSAYTLTLGTYLPHHPTPCVTLFLCVSRHCVYTLYL